MATRLPPNFSPFFEGNQLEVGCLDVKPRIRIPQNPEVLEDGLGKGNQGFRNAGMQGCRHRRFGEGARNVLFVGRVGG